MTRPVLTLKKPPARIAEPAQVEHKAAAPSGPGKFRKNVRRGVRFLADLNLPLFKQMLEGGRVQPMAIGIREEVLARTDPALADKVRWALRHIACSRGYQTALACKDARRRNADGEDVGAVE